MRVHPRAGSVGREPLAPRLLVVPSARRVRSVRGRVHHPGVTHSNHSSHSSIDGILILDALREIIAAELPRDPWAAGEPADLARKVAVAAVAVADDAGITREEWTAAAGHAGSEWVNALLRCLYGRSAALRILNHGLL